MIQGCLTAVPFHSTCCTISILNYQVQQLWVNVWNRPLGSHIVGALLPKCLLCVGTWVSQELLWFLTTSIREIFSRILSVDHVECQRQRSKVIESKTQVLFHSKLQNFMQPTWRLLLATGDSHFLLGEQSDLQSKKSQSSCLSHGRPSATRRPTAVLGNTVSRSRNFSLWPPAGSPKWLIFTSQRWKGSTKFESNSSRRSRIITASFSLFINKQITVTNYGV